MPVDRYIGDVLQELGCAITTFDLIEQGRCCVDKLRGVRVIKKFLVTDDIFQERQIGGNTTYSEFTQGPIHASNDFIWRWRPCRHLLEQRIIKTIDDCA